MYKNCINFSYLKLTLLMVFAYFLCMPSSVKANEDSYITKTVPAPSVSDDADASYRCVWQYASGNQEMARFHLYTASTDLLDLRGVTKILAPYSYHSAFYNYYGTDLKPEVYLVFSNGVKQAFTDGVWESDTPLNTSACIYYKYYAADYYWHPKSGANRDFDYASFSVSNITLYVDEKYKPIGFFVGSLSDTDKTAPCEVIANIHYAYYVSMPASLTLEPSITENAFISEYKVKVKLRDNGLAGKYIQVKPLANGYLEDENDSENKIPLEIQQDKIWFGMENTGQVEQLFTDKWSSIKGIVKAHTSKNGMYTGNFTFEYGIVNI